jgi:hypothetical protein
VLNAGRTGHECGCQREQGCPGSGESAPVQRARRPAPSFDVRSNQFSRQTEQAADEGTGDRPYRSERKRHHRRPRHRCRPCRSAGTPDLIDYSDRSACGTSTRVARRDRRREALAAARQAVFAMRANDEIGDDACHQIEEDVDWLEMADRGTGQGDKE